MAYCATAKESSVPHNFIIEPSGPGGQEGAWSDVAAAPATPLLERLLAPA